MNNIMSRIKQVEEIKKEIEEALKIYEELDEKYPQFSSFKFEIKNCSIEAMREIADGNDLNFWECIEKMTYQYSPCFPSIYLYSPKVEVKKHEVKNYAYKNV